MSGGGVDLGGPVGGGVEGGDHVGDLTEVVVDGRFVEPAAQAPFLGQPSHHHEVIERVRVDRDVGALVPIRGQPPSLQRVPSGCAFHPRCPFVFGRCREEVPPLETDGARAKACFIEWGMPLEIEPEPAA